MALSARDAVGRDDCFVLMCQSSLLSPDSAMEYRCCLTVCICVLFVCSCTCIAIEWKCNIDEPPTKNNKLEIVSDRWRPFKIFARSFWEHPMQTFMRVE